MSAPSRSLPVLATALQIAGGVPTFAGDGDAAIAGPPLVMAQAGGSPGSPGGGAPPPAVVTPAPPSPSAPPAQAPPGAVPLPPPGSLPSMTGSGSVPGAAPTPNAPLQTANPPLSAGGGPARPRSSAGGGGETLEECMALWDPSTHMTKETWRETCLRTGNWRDPAARK